MSRAAIPTRASSRSSRKALLAIRARTGFPIARCQQSGMLVTGVDTIAAKAIQVPGGMSLTRPICREGFSYYLMANASEHILDYG